MKSNFTKLYLNLKLKFKDENLLQTAFTHKSYLNESKSVIESNERLEFLGDSVLSLIISSYIFKLKPKDNEGDLTNLRSYIVKTESLAEASSKLDLGSYLLMSKGEELTGGRENTQLLANTYEALLGAIYIDLGENVARQFVSQTLLPLFVSELENGPPQDAKSKLQEFVQNKQKKSPHYKMIKTTGPDHNKTFIVGVYINGEEKGVGIGKNKQEAEEEAAKKALLAY